MKQTSPSGSTERRPQSTALAAPPQQLSQGSPRVILALARLATKMGEALDPEGYRLSLMAEDLADLPDQAVLYAISAWSRGESRHLSAFLQESTRIGVFFPKEAELRAIAQPYAAEMRDRQRAGDLALQEQLEAEDRKANPDRWITMADVMRGFEERNGPLLEKRTMQDPVSVAAPTKTLCPHCKAPVLVEGRGLSGLTSADLRELLSAVERVEQARGTEVTQAK